MLHNRRISLGLAAVAFSAFALLSPNTASAQLGRLKKAVGDAAKDAAGAKDKSSGTENFPITAERLDAVIATFEPAVLAAQRAATLKAATSEYEKARKAQEICFESASKALMANGGRPPTPTPEKIKQITAVSTTTSALMQRMGPAQQANHYREAAAIQDSMTVLSMSSSSIMMGLDSKCPKMPFKPAVMLDDDAMHMAGGGSSNQSTQLTVAPPARAGMTNYQFGMVRERAALWALQQTGNAPVGTNKYSVFTKDEQATLESRGDKLKKMVPFFKEQPTRWTGWSDLVNW
ncbi:MAG: hypothetical protein ABJC26_09150 [Gemmatimonadaceae bacterium]